MVGFRSDNFETGLVMKSLTALLAATILLAGIGAGADDGAPPPLRPGPPELLNCGVGVGPPALPPPPLPTETGEGAAVGKAL